MAGAHHQGWPRLLGGAQLPVHPVVTLSQPALTLHHPTKTAPHPTAPQVDSLAAELSGAQQRAEELDGALEESREQCAAQQGQVAQLERALASAHQLAAAAEQQRIEQGVLAAGLRAQLEQAAAREAALQASPPPAVACMCAPPSALCVRPQARPLQLLHGAVKSRHTAHPCPT